MRKSGDLLSLAEQTGEDFAFQMARTIHAQVLAHRDGSERQAGLQILTALRKTTIDTGFGRSFLPVIEVEIARASLDSGDLDAAIALSRTNLDSCFETGWMMWTAPATDVLVEALLKRGGEGDLDDARKAVDTLAAVPTDPGFVLNEPPLLHMRALLAHARAMTPCIAAIATTIARWPRNWVSKITSRWPRRCRDRVSVVCNGTAGRRAVLSPVRHTDRRCRVHPPSSNR